MRVYGGHRRARVAWYLVRVIAESAVVELRLLVLGHEIVAGDIGDGKAWRVRHVGGEHCTAQCNEAHPRKRSHLNVQFPLTLRSSLQSVTSNAENNTNKQTLTHHRTRWCRDTRILVNY